MVLNGHLIVLILAAVDPDEARRTAREILSEDPFTPREPPRPFKGLLRRFDELVVDPVQRFLDDLGARLPEFGTGPWLLLAAVVIAVAIAAVMRTAGDRNRERAARRFSAMEESDDPDRLEAAAAEAEAAGHLEAALRLRFRAGLLRLGRLGAVELTTGVTNATVRRRVCHPRFDHLALTFDEVVYGGRAATGADVGDARSGWPEVLTEVGTRS